MRHLIHATFALAAITLTACTGDEHPQLSMCQATTKHLVGGVSNWDSTDEAASGKQHKVDIAFTDAAGRAGTAQCVFKQKDDGSMETAPTSVVLNGQAVGARELITAGAQASKELLAGTAANTVAVTREFVDEAPEKARELAAEASKKAGELADQAGELAGEAGELAKDARRRLENAADALTQ